MKFKYYSFGIIGTILLGAIPIYLTGKPTLVFPLPAYIVLTSIWNLHPFISVGTFVFASLALNDQSNHVFKKRAILINSAITIGTLCWFILAKNHAIHYQGFPHYLVTSIINVIALVFLWWIALSNSFKKMIIYPLVLSFFLVWQAFPYFGELL